MNIAKACIQHKVATVLASIMVCIFGIMFGSRLQMALMPNLEAPMAVVVCYYVGATPSDIEELVTRPLESAVMSVAGVESIKSSSADSVSPLPGTHEGGAGLGLAAPQLRGGVGRCLLHN